MASGEYVSVSSQRDSERAMLALERRELAESPQAEMAELAQVYESRGLQPGLASGRLGRGDPDHLAQRHGVAGVLDRGGRTA